MSPRKGVHLPIISLPPDEDDEVVSSIALPRRLWAELTECASFESAIWEKANKGKVTRSDVIEHFLEWSIKQYWEEKGGRPVHAKKKEEAKQQEK